MDRSLDEIISERPVTNRGGRGGRRAGGGERRAPNAPRGPRRDDGPRDGVRKPRRDERTNIDSEWVHDRYEDEPRHARSNRRGDRDGDRYEPAGRDSNGAKIRVENVHYDLTEDDLRGLFEQQGPTESVKLMWDRQGRSQGTAFVTYVDPRDARRAVDEYHGCNANGQPIRLTLLPGGSLLDRMDKPERSLFDRIGGDDGRDAPRRRNRSGSPRRGAPRGGPAPDGIDRYVPGGRDSRSPARRGGGRAPRGGAGGREGGRRPGQKREGGGAGGTGERKPRTDDEGRPIIGGRPKKTAEELDAEMADYFNKPAADEPAVAKENGAAQQSAPAPAAAAPAVNDDDIDMAL